MKKVTKGRAPKGSKKAIMKTKCYQGDNFDAWASIEMGTDVTETLDCYYNGDGVAKLKEAILPAEQYVFLEGDFNDLAVTNLGRVWSLKRSRWYRINPSHMSFFYADKQRLVKVEEVMTLAGYEYNVQEVQTNLNNLKLLTTQP